MLLGTTIRPSHPELKISAGAQPLPTQPFTQLVCLLLHRSGGHARYNRPDDPIVVKQQVTRVY